MSSLATVLETLSTQDDQRLKLAVSLYGLEAGLLTEIDSELKEAGIKAKQSTRQNPSLFLYPGLTAKAIHTGKRIYYINIEQHYNLDICECGCCCFSLYSR